MVPHGRDHSRLGGLLQSFALDEGVVQVVALGLLPYIVRCVVPGPQNQVHVVPLLQLLREKGEGLKRQVTIAQTAPVVSGALVSLIGLQVLFV